MCTQKEWRKKNSFFYRAKKKYEEECGVCIYIAAILLEQSQLAFSFPSIHHLIVLFQNVYTISFKIIMILRTKYKNCLLFTPEKKKKKNKQICDCVCARALHFQKKKLMALLERMKTTTQINTRKNVMKWRKGINRPKYTQQSGKFCIVFPISILSNGIDWLIAYMLSSAYLCHLDRIECMFYRYRSDNGQTLFFFFCLLEFPFHNIDFSIFCLLLIFSAWNNRIIRSKCLLSQISSSNQYKQTTLAHAHTK